MYFQRDTKVYLVWDGGAIALPALASFSSSQTLSERKYSKNTINSPSLVDAGFVNERSKTSFSLETYAAPELLKLLNFQLVDGTYRLQNTKTLVKFDIYFEVTSNFYYAIKNAYATQLTTSMGKGTILKFLLEGEGSQLISEQKPNIAYNYLDHYITGDLANINLLPNNFLVSAAYNIVREIRWLNTKTMLEGEDYIPTKAVLTGLEIGGNLATYCSDSSFQPTDNFKTEFDLIIGTFGFHLGESLITERMDFSSSILTKYYDFRLLPQGVVNTTIRYPL